MDQLLAKSGITADGPGAAVVIVEGGRVIFERCCGLTHLDEQTPIRRETTFELASLSKIFTASAILILHERGQLALTDDVRIHVPEIPLYDRRNPIRIEDLLRHTSGLPEYLAVPGVKGRNPAFLVNEDFARDMASRPRKYPQQFPAGTRHLYCNTNYLLLALIIERVSGKTFGTFLHDEIFEPLGMVHSWVHESPAAVLPHPELGFTNAVGYSRGEDDRFVATWGTPPFRSETLLTTGDGAVWSSLEDLLCWDAGLRAERLLSSETMQQAWTPTRTSDGEISLYGLGWRMSVDAAGQANEVWHNGTWGGFRSTYYRSLTEDRSIIILSNCGPLAVGDLGDEMNEAIRAHHQGEMPLPGFGIGVG